MKNIKLMVLALLAFLPVVGLQAQYVDTVVNEGNSGTTSATVIVKPSALPVNITDLMVRTDANNVSATCDIRYGDDVRYPVTSATTASQSVIWFNNASPTRVAALDYVILGNAGTYSLLRCKTSAATSITVQETITPAVSTSDNVWSVATRVRRPVVGLTVSSTAQPVNIWLPANVPSAITLDGNTTSCQISASGVRSNAR